MATAHNMGGKVACAMTCVHPRGDNLSAARCWYAPATCTIPPVTMVANPPRARSSPPTGGTFEFFSRNCTSAHPTALNDKPLRSQLSWFASSA